MREGHSLGVAAENIAALFLSECGFSVLDRRFRRPGGEIDLVVRRGNIVAFVEVKARRPSRCGTALESVSRRQLLRLRRMARLYLHEHPQHCTSVIRFDVVSIDFGGEGRGFILRHLVGVGS